MILAIPEDTAVIFQLNLRPRQRVNGIDRNIEISQ